MTIKKILLFSIIGFVIAIVAFGSVFYFATHKQEPYKEKRTYTYAIDELYTNIKDSRRILKVNIVIETTDEKIIEQLEHKVSKITNDILELLRSKDEKALYADKGQQVLRKEVLACIKSSIPSDKIADTYFTQFIIQ